MDQSHSKPSLEAIAHLIETVHRLRAPGGCPWDRAQTHQSLRQYLVEEAYEVMDVLDQIDDSRDLEKEKVRLAFREELGDLLMQVLLHSEMANEVGAFGIYDVAQALDQKLIRRHPHVFGETKADSAESAIQKWEKEKAKEKASQPQASILDGVPRGLPALQRVSRVLEKVTKVGFQWNDMTGPLEKVDEELAEFKAEVLALEKLRKGTESGKSSEQEKTLLKRIESELGDLFFTLCNVSYLLKINPEDSLRSTMARFEKRFRYVEQSLKAQGKTPEQSDLDEMDRYWSEAKKLEKVQIWGLTGGIASGKSTAAKLFEEQGIPVVDADQIAKELSSEGGQAHAAIIAQFGTADRKELRKLVFSNPQAKSALEAILHPLIFQESQRRFRELSQKHSTIIYEATLLIETGRSKDLNGLILVEAPTPIRVERLKARDAISQEMCEQILASQTSDETRRKYADVILENSKDIDHLRKQVLSLTQEKGWKAT